MRYLAALLAAAALAGCGAAAGVTTPGRRARTSATGVSTACPRSDRAKPVSRSPGADSTLVPGKPDAVLLCRYSGLNGHPRLALTGSRTITDAGTVAHLAHELDSMRKPPSGVISCPADFGDAVIAFFEYATEPADPVTVGLSGCGRIGNGHITRLAGPAKSPVLGQIASLTRE